MSDLDDIGGFKVLRGIMREFLERERHDMIIGFLFEGRDLERIAEHEAQFAAGHLGGKVEYEGRGMAPVHRPLKINRGHFRRRLAILKTLLLERGVPEAIITRWIAHDQTLQGVVTDGTDCV